MSRRTRGKYLNVGRFTPEPDVATFRRSEVVDYLLREYKDDPALPDIAMKIEAMMQRGVPMTRELVDFLMRDENADRVRKWQARVRQERQAAEELRRDLTTYVYFIEHGDRIKIGFSANPKQRAQALSLRESNILAVIEGGQKLEQRLHARFAASRVGDTEWFMRTDELMAFIAEYGERFTKHHRSRRADLGQPTAETGYERLAVAMGLTKSAE